jgi:hypothetical protein
MAQAFGSYRFPYGKGGQSEQRMLCSAWFWGPDVSDEIDGQIFEIEVFMIESWGLSDLKTAFVQAIKDKGTELGLTVVNSDIYVVSLEGA